MLSFVPAHFVLRPVRCWDVAELTALVTWYLPYNFLYSVFGIHLCAILNNLYIVTYLSIYIWQGCLIERQRLMFKKSDTLSLIELHFVMIVTMATQFTLL